MRKKYPVRGFLGSCVCKNFGNFCWTGVGEKIREILEGRHTFPIFENFSRAMGKAENCEKKSVGVFWIQNFTIFFKCVQSTKNFYFNQNVSMCNENYRHYSNEIILNLYGNSSSTLKNDSITVTYCVLYKLIFKFLT